MAKKGGAILLVYTDLIDDKYDEEFNAWYDTQHLPQLLELPGVLDAARYVAVKGGPKYLAAYEVESVDTVLGPAWENRPITMSLSIGDGSSYCSSRQRSSPFTTTGYALPSSARARSAAAS